MSKTPANRVFQGDDQIRTGVPCLGTDPVYEARGTIPPRPRTVWLLIAAYTVLLVANLAHQGGVG